MMLSRADVRAARELVKASTTERSAGEKERVREADQKERAKLERGKSVGRAALIVRFCWFRGELVARRLRRLGVTGFAVRRCWKGGAAALRGKLCLVCELGGNMMNAMNAGNRGAWL